MRQLLTGLFCCAFIFSNAQGPLTVEKIMRDPKWMGTSPSSPFWNDNSNIIYFQWNPNNDPGDSLYSISLDNKTPRKLTLDEKKEINAKGYRVYNNDYTKYITYSKGDLWYTDEASKVAKRITNTVENESNPVFSFNEKRIVYNRNQNLYSWNIATGETEQLTNFKSEDQAASPTPNLRNTGSRETAKGNLNAQDQWLQNDQIQYLQIVRERKNKRLATDSYNKLLNTDKEMKSISLEGKSISGIAISPDGRYITYRLYKPNQEKGTIVPSYVTESGYTTELNTRSKVGSTQTNYELYIYDRVGDSVITFRTASIPGIEDIPDFYKDYPSQLEEAQKKHNKRSIYFASISWNPSGACFVADIHSTDNKDRWLMKWDANDKSVSLVNRQHDEAWIGGPGTTGYGSSSIGWISEKTFWYRSEQTGYSHIYTADINTLVSKPLTEGNYEVQQAQLSKNKKYFFITTNEVHPGEQQFYKLTIADGKKERITTLTGANQVTISPDEKYVAILYSAPTEPWELYLQENKAGGKLEKITNLAKSAEFNSYQWQEPDLIRFAARDGALVYARVYKPKNPTPNAPAVLFVHGAGYLQNAHKWWSSYFREFMFNNLLAENGYYVMDIDYRGSAGYGRDWRTGIYRHMGGKDLTDNIDAVKYMVDKFQVDPKRVGLYGGSYGGFITLMGMFNAPETFSAGAALRPVTDWANYNHGYTSNILNEPFNDSIAYKRSSPIYFASGLKGDLLICHGMMDVNVHYQDAVKLAQRLIELGKDNWELASYPMEDHGFVEPSSWTDEYKRIFKLFEKVLKK
jgi:dipeptidyl aminopeptidase/acylaminoacyl peptidase